MKWLKVLAPSFAFAGVQASWAVQIGHGTAHLRKLGLSNELVAFAWLAGPVTGLLVQPIVGSWSDRCTSRFGRRKPFMLGGAIGMAIGLVLFSQSANLAAKFGDPISPTGGGSPTGLHIAILAFWMTDTFTNALQGPSRCLMADSAQTGESLSFGNSVMAAGNGVGKVIGYAAGSFAPGIEVTYGVIAVVATMLTVLTCVISDDIPIPVKSVDEENGKLEDISPSIKKSMFSLHTLVDMPRAVAKAFLIQSFTYFALMLLFVYGANWGGKEVFNGSADAAPSSAEHAAYETGVLVANRGFLLMASFSIAMAMSLTPLCRKFGVKPVWSASLLCLGASLICTLLVRNESTIGVLIVFSFLSFPLAMSFTIPWTVASLALREELGDEVKHELGAHMATFNGSQAFACLLASIMGGLIVRIVGGEMERVLAVGGVAAIIGSALVYWTEIPTELETMTL